jgi:UTP--glucose-1-phosphate uridylyltransferase
LHHLSEEQLAYLRRFGFDADLQRRWQQAVADGRMSVAANAVTGDLLAPPPGAVQMLPGASTKASRELERIGTEAIAAGQLGVVVLNGGMATRFGGVVKCEMPSLG